MNNVTVRASLMGVLLVFAAMLLAGAGLGVHALSKANHAMSTMYQTSIQVIAINDAYKDTTRTRSAMTRGYTVVKDGGAPADLESALASARKSYTRGLDFIAKYEKAASYQGEDVALKKSLLSLIHI